MNIIKSLKGITPEMVQSKSFGSPVITVKVETVSDHVAKKPSSPKSPSQPIFYFLNVGFVSYGNGYTLLDRQVIPFADVSTMWHRKDVYYVRACLKMQADGPIEPGKMVLNETNIPANMRGFAEVDGCSYMAYSRSDSVAGFSSRYYAESSMASATEVQKLVDLCRFTEFAMCCRGSGPLDTSVHLWPSFFVQADEGDPQAVRVYQAEQQRWLWAQQLIMETPVTLGYPLPHAVNLLKHAERSLWERYQFNGPIYIGMRNICHKVLGAEEMSPWMLKQIRSQQLYEVMDRYDLRFEAWTYPAPKEVSKIREFEAKVLNALALYKLNQMS